jgi:Na+-transporting NADH:ubiquinone oxidoreductase subunit NqrE
MKNRMIRSRSAIRSQILMRNATRDGVVGALLGLLLLSGLIVSTLDVRQMMSDNRELLPLLGTVVAVIVLQCGIAAGLCGFAIRKYTLHD